MSKTLILAILLAAFPVALQADTQLNSLAHERTEHDQSQRSLAVIGLTQDQRLISFDEYYPGQASNIGFVSGLTGGDTTLVGIDFRVQNGQLYGVGNLGGVYLLDTTTAVATFVNHLSVALSGVAFGVDFNPVADRLRIISDAGQNLRHDVNAGGVTTVDLALNYTVGVTALGLTGAAYTNNDLDATTATTLYALDSTLDQVAIQSPPNNGSLVATGLLTVDTGATVGFDIYSTLRNGITQKVQGFASLTGSDGRARFYRITLPTGKANSRGLFNLEDQVVDIAVPLNQL